MTSISHLTIVNLRNLQEVSVDFGEHLNLIYGPNGSGKTSLLEAVYLLAAGRSFRSSKTNPLIRHESKELTVFAKLNDGNSIGLTRSRNQPPLLKLQGQKQANWLEVARLIPVQIIDSDIFRLIEGGPGDRRRFLDWGVFHVKPSFVVHWRNSKKCIANRNLLLKMARPDRDQIHAWDAELCKEAELVDSARREYLSAFIPVFNEVAAKIGVKTDISISYKRGWDESTSLSAALKSNIAFDLKYGTTQTGPHRAELVFRHEGRLAEEVLSRGQQKIVVCALKLAQGISQSRNGARPCLYLVDDLPAELDKTNRASVFRFLESLQSQVIMTCVERSALENSLESSALVAKFHVEHGKMTI